MMENQQIPLTQQQKRILPQNDLDLALMTTDSVWGKSEVPLGLKTKLEQYFIQQAENGQKIVITESLWDLLGFYTRDMRLANLSTWNGEFQYCQYYLDLAGDFLQGDLIKPFLICISRVATILELSQSKGGFLRRKMNTFTQESIQSQLEPPKKSLFGVNKNKEMSKEGYR